MCIGFLQAAYATLSRLHAFNQGPTHLQAHIDHQCILNYVTPGEPHRKKGINGQETFAHTQSTSVCVYVIIFRRRVSFTIFLDLGVSQVRTVHTDMY